MQLKKTQIDSYHRDGFLLLRGALSEDIINAGWLLYDSWLDEIIAQWREEGLLRADLTSVTAPNRVYEAWLKADRPKFRRRPFRYLINEAVFHYLKSPIFLHLAKQLLDTPDIRMHGVYNARLQPPECEWATPPFHQDAQFWNSEVGIDDTDPETHVLTMWFPLHPVDGQSGALEMISLADCGQEMFELVKVNYEETGFVGMRPEVAERFPSTIMSMEAGDILLFNQKAPHRATLNQVDQMRFSYDLRYEALESDTAVGRKYGFIAQCPSDRSKETTAEEWVRKRDLYLAWTSNAAMAK